MNPSIPKRLLICSLLCGACASSREDLSLAWPPSGPQGPDFAAPADVDLSGEVGLGRLLEAAAERNPRLKAARERWKAASERPTQARSLPDPLLSYTGMARSIETRVGPMQGQLQLMQKIPFPGKLAAAGKEAEARAAVKRLEYGIALRDVVADVKVSYSELSYLKKAEEIVEQNRALATQLAQQGAQLHAKALEEGSDAATLFDVLRAQSELAQLSYDEITLSELERTEEAKLNRLLHRPPEAPLGDLKPLAFRPLTATRDELCSLALANRQEIRAATRKIAAADEAERLAKLSRVPDFTLGAAYTFIGGAQNPVPDSGKDALGFTIGLSLPLFEHKNRAKIREAEAMRAAAEQDRLAAVDDVLARISEVYFRLENAGRLVRLYKDSLLPQAEEALQTEEERRQAGRDPLARVLEGRAILLRFQLAAERAKADYEESVARLEQLVGESLGAYRAAPEKGGAEKGKEKSK